MRDWPIAGVALLMLVSFLGASWSLREPDTEGAIRRAWRRSAARLWRFGRAFSRLTGWQRIAVSWLAVVSLLVLIRAVFALAAAAHTEQGVIVGFLALALVACGAVLLGLNSLRARLRSPS